jgi:para-aminobenzoate synthetase
VPPVVVRNDEWSWRDVYNWVYKERAFDNIVISPGPGSPACPSDIGEHTPTLIQLLHLLCLWEISVSYMFVFQVYVCGYFASAEIYPSSVSALATR